MKEKNDVAEILGKTKKGKKKDKSKLKVGEISIGRKVPSNLDKKPLPGISRSSAKVNLNSVFGKVEKDAKESESITAIDEIVKISGPTRQVLPSKSTKVSKLSSTIQAASSDYNVDKRKKSDDMKSSRSTRALREAVQQHSIVDLDESDDAKEEKQQSEEDDKASSTQREILELQEQYDLEKKNWKRKLANLQAQRQEQEDQYEDTYQAHEKEYKRDLDKLKKKYEQLRLEYTEREDQALRRLDEKLDKRQLQREQQFLEEHRSSFDTLAAAYEDSIEAKELLERKVSDLEDELATSDQLVKDSKLSVESLSAENVQLSKSIVTMENDMMNLKSKTAADLEKATFNVALDDLSASADAELNAKFETNVSELQNISETLKQTEEKYELLVVEKKQVDNCIQGHIDEIQQLKSRLIAAEERTKQLEQLESEVIDDGIKLDDVCQKELQKKCNDLELGLTDEKLRHEATIADRNLKNEKVDLLSKKQDELIEQVQTLQMDLTASKLDQQKLIESAATVEETMSALKNDKLVLQEKIELKTLEVVNSSAHSTEMQAKQSNSTEQLESQKVEIVALKMKLDAMEIEAKDSKSAHDELIDEMKIEQERLNDLVKVKQNMLLELDESSRNDTVHEDLKQALFRGEKMKEDINSMQTKIQELESELNIRVNDVESEKRQNAMLERSNAALQSELVLSEKKYETRHVEFEAEIALSRKAELQLKEDAEKGEKEIQRLQQSLERSNRVIQQNTEMHNLDIAAREEQIVLLQQHAKKSSTVSYKNDAIALIQVQLEQKDHEALKLHQNILHAEQEKKQLAHELDILKLQHSGRNEDIEDLQKQLDAARRKNMELETELSKQKHIVSALKRDAEIGAQDTLALDQQLKSLADDAEAKYKTQICNLELSIARKEKKIHAEAEARSDLEQTLREELSKLEKSSITQQQRIVNTEKEKLNKQHKEELHEMDIKFDEVNTKHEEQRKVLQAEIADLQTVN